MAAAAKPKTNPNVIPGFGARLTEARHKAGLTQTDLAGKAGVTQGMLLHLEKDRKSPSLVVLCRLANALGCTIDSLIPWEQVRG